MTPAHRSLLSKILSVVLSGGIGIGAGVLIRRTLLDSPKADSPTLAKATQPARKAKEHPPFSTKAGEPDEVAIARLLRTASLEESLKLIVRGHPKCTTDGHFPRGQSAPLPERETPPPGPV